MHSMCIKNVLNAHYGPCRHDAGTKAPRTEAAHSGAPGTARAVRVQGTLPELAQEGPPRLGGTSGAGASGSGAHQRAANAQPVHPRAAAPPSAPAPGVDSPGAKLRAVIAKAASLIDDIARWQALADKRAPQARIFGRGRQRLESRIVALTRQATEVGYACTL